MGLWEPPQSSSKDLIAFVVACLFGYGIASVLPPGLWHAYASVLVSYHLFLVWLVITAEDEAGLSFPLASTIFSHAAFIGTVIAILIACRYIPLFRFFGMGVAGLSYFEKKWLFGGERNQVRASETQPPVMDSTPSDYQEWTKHLAQRKSSSVIHGVSVKDEYERWVRARTKSQPTESSGD